MFIGQHQANHIKLTISQIIAFLGRIEFIWQLSYKRLIYRQTYCIDVDKALSVTKLTKGFLKYILISKYRDEHYNARPVS